MIYLFNKRRINLLIFVILVFTSAFILWGCGSDETPASSNASESSESSAFYISGIIFLDLNGNGTFDSGETGIKGINVSSQSDGTQTDSNGEYRLESKAGSDTIRVDTATVPAGLVLTTDNDTQTFTISSDTQADAIGYIEPQSSTPMFSFRDSINDGNTYDNYYFELIMFNAGQQEETLKLWVMGNSMKAEAQGMTTFFNQENGTMGVYTAATNQVVITPIMEMMPIMTPFTFMDEFDPQTFDDIMYKGEENLDGKDVLVFENTVPGFEAKYYVWKEHKIIIKMEASSGTYEGSFYFKDLSLGSVTQDDINYPAGAEVLNLSGQ